MSLFNVFQVSSSAMTAQSMRLNAVASNLANADTPGYKARDLDFAQAMSSALGTAPPLKATHAAHLQARGDNPGELLYRTSAQMSLDGNSVDVEREKAQFADNALRYQASLHFLGKRVQGLLTAIKGE